MEVSRNLKTIYITNELEELMQGGARKANTSYHLSDSV